MSRIDSSSVLYSLLPLSLNRDALSTTETWLYLRTVSLQPHRTDLVGITLQICIRKVRGSNLDPVTGGPQICNICTQYVETNAVNATIVL
jgi:hypothetical protein